MSTDTGPGAMPQWLPDALNHVCGSDRVAYGIALGFAGSAWVAGWQRGYEAAMREYDSAREGGRLFLPDDLATAFERGWEQRSQLDAERHWRRSQARVRRATARPVTTRRSRKMLGATPFLDTMRVLRRARLEGS